MADGRLMITHRNGGFTLIEMMVVVAVTAALLMLAAPAFTDLIKDNKLLSEVYALRATLNNARSEALAQRTFVTICSSTDGEICATDEDWQEGYIAFVDADGDGVVDDPNDPDGDQVFIAKVMDSPGLDIEYIDSGGTPINRLRFSSRGYAREFNGTFAVCDDRGPKKSRGVIVASIGGVRAAVDLDPNDPDGAGIVNDHTGANLACN